MNKLVEPSCLEGYKKCCGVPASRHAAGLVYTDGLLSDTNLDTNHDTSHTEKSDHLQQGAQPPASHREQHHCLYVGDSAGTRKDPDYNAFIKEYPDVAIDHFTTDHLLDETKEMSRGVYDYIYIYPQASRANGDRIMDALPRILELLNEDGQLFISLYGYAGYYGLSLVSRIVRKFAVDLLTDQQKNAARIRQVVKAVMGQLSPEHPAFGHPEFMERLKAGHKKSYDELLTLNNRTVFTVKRLIERIEAGGGRFVDWWEPGLYDPVMNLKGNSIDQKIIAELRELDVPRKWVVAEMLNAFPREHWFFIAKK